MTVDDASRRSETRRRRSTATSNFGVGRREGHDATEFYARFGRFAVSDDAELRRPREVDRIWCHDARDMDPFVEDKSVALVVTSPPYFAGKAYEQALGEGGIPASYTEYLQMLHDVFQQCWNKLEPGGRIAVNVANLGRRPYRSLAADVIDILEQLGYLLRGEIVWQKSIGASGSCAWGTFQRPGNPVLRDLTERVVLASKGRFDRALSPAARAAAGWPHEGSMTADDFVDATLDVWAIPPESATRVGHPAPFPVELPRRLIDLFTYRGDLVLDPFMGSGSTAVAAVLTDRHFAGFDTDESYAARAMERAARADRERPATQVRVVVPAAKDTESGDPIDDLDRARAGGEAAVKVVERLLELAGFTDVARKVVLPGVGLDVPLRATGPDGHTWLVEVVGAFSSTRPGLRKQDVLMRAIGEASVLHAARLEGGRTARGLGPLLVFTTEPPAAASPAGRALAPFVGPGRPFHAVLDLLDPDVLDALRRAVKDGETPKE